MVFEARSISRVSRLRAIVQQHQAQPRTQSRHPALRHIARCMSTAVVLRRCCCCCCCCCRRRLYPSGDWIIILLKGYRLALKRYLDKGDAASLTSTRVLAQRARRSCTRLRSPRRLYCVCAAPVLAIPVRETE